ncbi:MAG: nucleotidyltransferase domain-containing protein [Thermodesulfobacteriota bacterium]|nr:nucleotidyltransferase domain-containing protein [Thermodesulfobacteriota bacterium]
MALSEARLDEIVRGFVSRLSSEMPVEGVILFGSYAYGNPEEHSDIDLAIISDWFQGKTRIENMQHLSRIAARYNSLIEAYPFTAEEYRNLDHRTLLASIVKHGRRYAIDGPPYPGYTTDPPQE